MEGKKEVKWCHLLVDHIMVQSFIASPRVYFSVSIEDIITCKTSSGLC